MYIYSNEIECFIRTVNAGTRAADLKKALARFECAYRTFAQGSGCKCYSIWTSILVSLSLADRPDLWSYENRLLDLSDPATQDRANNLAFALALRMRFLTMLPRDPKFGCHAVRLLLQLASACERDI